LLMPSTRAREGAGAGLGKRRGEARGRGVEVRT